MVDHLRRHRSYILMFVLNVAVLLGVIYLLRPPEPRVIAITTPSPRVTPTGAQIQVQVTGAIVSPGVYTLTLGSRVADVLDAAGGARPDANLDELNLARKLNDGDGIDVPTRTAGIKSFAGLAPTFPVESSAVPSHLKIDINAATAAQLDTLPHIGTVLAQRIIDYRSSQGPFKKIEDIKNVTGIGDAVFEDLKDLIIVK